MRKFIPIIIIVAIFGGWYYWSELRINDAPPSYIKDVVAYKEGSDGILIYFVLADQSGAPTAGLGSYAIQIFEERSEWSSETESYEDSRVLLYSCESSDIISKADFRIADVGLGAFKRKQLLYPVGRITYSEFDIRPEKGSRGLVKVYFGSLTDSSVDGLQGETTITF